MEISDQLFKEISDALALAHKNLELVKDFCKEVKTATGLDTDNICNKIDDVIAITNSALAKAISVNA